MSNWNDLNQASAALNDPGLPAAELMAIAAAQPSLWPRVAKHPAAYPDLLDWLRDRGAATEPQAAPSAGKGPGAASPPAAAEQSPSSQAAPPGSRAQPPTPKTKGKRRGLVVGIVIAVVVVWIGLGIRAELVGRSHKPPPAPALQSELPTSGAVGQGRSISLTSGADPVTYAAGERPFQGAAEMSGVDSAEVGFFLAADGSSIRQITLGFQGGRLGTEFGITGLTQSFSAIHDLKGGKVRANLEEGAIVLELTFAGNQATGTLTFSDELDTNTGTARTLDLGVGEVRVHAVS